MDKVKSISDDGTIVTVECHLANSLPNIVIVGFANRSTEEARERIRGALTNSNISIPRKRIILNLAPADFPKEGSSFDLAMLIAILARSGNIHRSPGSQTAVFGEVGLDGSIRPVRGIIGKILAAKQKGLEEFWLPTGNLPQASLIPGIKLLPFNNVKQLYSRLKSTDQLTPTCYTKQSSEKSKKYTSEISIDDIAGQARAKRTLLIALAGHHNILFTGPPGTGKTLLAKAAVSLLPDLTSTEIMESTHLHSLATRDFDQIVDHRPLRAPHHSASLTSILGGGYRPTPGEVSLSHNGILLFDELPEFSRTVIESLRQPLEEKEISVTRSRYKAKFAADFLFIATANPCPCGYYNSSRPCTCSTSQIQSYQKKISGPILDRIDLYVEVDPVAHNSLLSKETKKQETNDIRLLIETARNQQLKSRGKLNGQLSNQDLKALKLSRQARKVMDQAAAAMDLSARAYLRSLKVARTIADLGASEEIEAEHVSEALQYRKRRLQLTSVV